MSEFEPTIDPDGYWSQDARDERDEWDAHVRHVEDDERERLTRDLPARQTSPSLRGTTERGNL